VRILLSSPFPSCLSQLLRAGQGRPDEEVPRILKQLPRQVEAASSPSDLRELLSAVMFLAEVVVEARMQLDHNAMKVKTLSHSSGPSGQ
jgi:G protein-coupled receptor 113